MARTTTITEALLTAITGSGQSLYVISREANVNKSALGRFVAGKQSLRLDFADRLALHLKLELRSATRRKRSK